MGEFESKDRKTLQKVPKWLIKTLEGFYVELANIDGVKTRSQNLVENTWEKSQPRWSARLQKCHSVNFSLLTIVLNIDGPQGY